MSKVAQYKKFTRKQFEYFLNQIRNNLKTYKWVDITNDMRRENNTIWEGFIYSLLKTKLFRL